MSKPRVGAAVAAFVGERGWQRVGAVEWAELRGAFADVTAGTLRKHLVAAGVEVEQPWLGPDTSSLDALELSLRELAKAYLAEPKLARAVVIEAKDRAKFVARNEKVAAEKRAEKTEMVEWMLVWLGDPAMFGDWVRLRRGVMGS